MQKLSLFSVVLIAGVVVALPASAQVYKWKDEQGRTVVSDKPRPGGGREDLVVPPAQRDLLQEQPTAATPEQTMADKELDFRKRRQDKAEATAKAEEEGKEAEKKADDCKRAQNYLKSLESGRRIGVVDESGATIPMDDAARKKAIEDTRAYLKESCGG